ncbi:unnamed protein product [Blepharisma stoltei]|uniref:Uncharacterized protein n=1 Tax=Blepharisma stoltei TaxID=1481888 RepID=A0AAU9JA25_9CILI|nr:unnamed protein product [Blepharisma stoltei]
MSDFSDFDPANISSSSEEEVPAKRKPQESIEKLEKESKLPNPLELLAKARSYKPIKVSQEKTKVKTNPYENAVIKKEPVMKANESDALEQYDYFANAGDAVLEHWNAPQELPDKEKPLDKRKFIRKQDFRKKKVEGLTGVKAKEFLKRQKGQSTWKRWKTDEEVQMRQNYDS